MEITRTLTFKSFSYDFQSHIDFQIGGDGGGGGDDEDDEDDDDNY